MASESVFWKFLLANAFFSNSEFNDTVHVGTDELWMGLSNKPAFLAFFFIVSAKGFSMNMMPQSGSRNAGLSNALFSLETLSIANLT